MHVRILKIRGDRKQTRQQRLKQTRSWMEAHGWRLMDYSEELGSVAFERAEGAPPLGWFDRTRYLPGPDWFQPREWLRRPLGSPRKLAFAGGIGLAVMVAFVLLLNFSHSAGPVRMQGKRERAESWFYVTVDSLNIRAEPKPGAQIVGVLYLNQRVLVGERTKGWARIVKPEWGYIAERFLQDHPAR